MGMSDCSKCWDTPCRCGYDYLDRDIEYINDQIKMLTEIKKFREKNKRIKNKDHYYELFLKFKNERNKRE